MRSPTFLSPVIDRLKAVQKFILEKQDQGLDGETHGIV
jgi:hypothetical protein